MKECSVRRVVKIAFVLAFFQAMFTLVGYLLGFSFLKLIETIDHWIAFGLLLYLGGRMIWESRQEKEEDKKMNPLCLKTLCGLGIATSIDALAVGVSLAIMQTSLSVITWTIGIVTFLFSSFGGFEVRLDRWCYPNRNRSKNLDRTSFGILIISSCLR